MGERLWRLPDSCARRPALCGLLFPLLSIDVYRGLAFTLAVVPWRVTEEFALYSFLATAILVGIFGLVFWRRLGAMEEHFQRQIAALQASRPAGDLGVKYLEERFRQLDERLMEAQAEIRHMRALLEENGHGPRLPER
jgi:hypothetical protein